MRRAFAVLEDLSTRGEATLHELAQSLGLKEPTMHRLLGTLIETGYAEQPDVRGKYRLTMRMFEVGARLLDRSGLREQARPIMEELADRTGESVHLAVLDGTEVVYVEKVDSSHSLLLRARVGERRPFHATAVGKAMAAFLPLDSRERLVERTELGARTPYTVTDAARLRSEFEQIRRQGFAVDDREQDVNIRSVAAPVFGRTGRVLGALSVAGPASRLCRREVLRLGPRLRRAADRVSAGLGWGGTADA